MDKVTIVIPNYNGCSMLDICLESIIKNNTLETSIVVVDNGSTDNSREMVKTKYPSVRFIGLDKNYGFCKAVNVGIKSAYTDYVLLLNNDIEIDALFVEKMYSAIRLSNKIFSVEACMIQYYNRTLIDSAGTFYNAFGWAFARGSGKAVGKYSRSMKTFATCAGAAIYRKSVFEEIGYFDEAHFAYLEDVDIGYRARLHGYINKYEAEARVYHMGSKTSGSKHNGFKVKHSVQNNIYLIYKNMPFIQIVVNFPFLLFGFLIKFIFFFLKGLGRDYAKGFVSGFRVAKQNHDKKVCIKPCMIGSIMKIQLELWLNLIRRFS
ncbi:glycosyltransferase family 2 protein [Ohessyouella blattaphilus]|uniref:Glycosyltransferase family 2 protein n=1 Tax=Ohessyouella blattaphilus TaxID=2949333 RepID=A0ABT1EH90_9FIRM|nr:glycosyltransferase family 2 protein [Ohessyouella blattaphilus]MCP1108662.1 glycosyltransferase family 2 protein [Ohessyouella blattaphilus]MCR8562056.1 glycosyltransferase family 2 protein [Ohessyouella blattaphilus]